MGQAEFGADFTGKDRDEEGLAETGKKGQKRPGGQPGSILQQKGSFTHSDGSLPHGTRAGAGA